MIRAALAVTLLAAAGCTGAQPLPGAVESDIIGGTTDTADDAVVLLFETIPGQQGGNLCTGEVISPHVILTAAHCTGGENPAVTNAIYQVYVGPDFGKATAAQMLPVKEVHYNAAFNVGNLTAGNDIGVAILTNPIAATIKPLVMNRTPLDPSHDGKPVRFVGYGLDNAAAQTGAGVKRQTTTTLADHNALLLHFTDGLHETCNGDSGGPAFMNIGGQDVIIGLTSYGDVNCNQGGYDTRVDTLVSWVDPWVKQFDPGFVATSSSNADMGNPSGGNNSTPPAPSGGAQSPPTSSATPTPPSSAGAGGVGASCVSDHDCQSRLCGLDNKGGHVCFAANANTGGMGCSAASGGGGRASGNGALMFALCVGLGFKLARARKKARR